MDKSELVEKKKRLAELSVLEENLKKLENELKTIELDAEFLLSKYQDRAKARESLKNDFLFSTVMKITGKFNSEVAKLTEDMEMTRLEYNKLVEKIKEKNAECEQFKSRILVLNQEKNDFIEEMRRREEILENYKDREISVQYKQLKSDQVLLSSQIADIDKVIEMVKRLNNTAYRAKHNISMSNMRTISSKNDRSLLRTVRVTPDLPSLPSSDYSENYISRMEIQIRDLTRMIDKLESFDNSPYRSVFDRISDQLNKIKVIKKDIDYVRQLGLIIEEIAEVLNKLKSKIQEHACDIEAQIDELIILV